MRDARARTILLSLLAAGCSVNSTKGISNGGIVTRLDGGGTGTGGNGLALGAPCTSNAACDSTLCGLAGTGNCCAQACPSANATCQASGCDDGGSCSYAPSGTACGPLACSGHFLTGQECDGHGGCTAQSDDPCPDNLGCNDAGTACNTGCSSSTDCATGTSCNHGLCAPPVPSGPCSEADDCQSGICGVDGGSGHCCHATCLTTLPCGAADCDDFGDCVYADTTTVCAAPSCNGSTLQPVELCDGLGDCEPSQTVPCAPYACTSEGCDTSCTDDSSCVAGFCDMAVDRCCPLAAGDTITLSDMGNDAVGCCGIGGNGDCLTIAHAMQVIDRAQAANVTLQARLISQLVWQPAGEVFPIALGWGAELIAPYVSFAEPFDGGSPAIFDIGPFSARDPQGSASIGGGTNYVDIGLSASEEESQSPRAILVEPGATLYLSNALVYSNADYQTTAIEVSAGGTLVLGGDQAGTFTGGVSILGPSIAGYNGILCDSANGAGCTITDVPQDAGNSLWIEYQRVNDIDAEDFANITLSSTPVIGGGNVTPGFDACAKTEAVFGTAAVRLHGKARMTFDNGFVDCSGADGFRLEASTNGVPSLTLNGTTLQNDERAIYASAGSVAIANSTIQFNYRGVEQDTDGTNVATIDLGGGDAGGTNTVACSSSVESFFQPQSQPGVSVLNDTVNPLNASNVEWDTPSPDAFNCGPGFTACSCAIASCEVDAGADGMDAVSESTGAITTTGNGLSPLNCMP